MAKEEYIRDYPSREILGIVRYESNGDQMFLDFPGRRVLGFYRASRDVTTDFAGNILTPGNSGISLIYKKVGK